MTALVYNGGPCTCALGRYVRFVVQPAPGLLGTVSCRGNGSAKDDVREHPIPRGAEVLVRVPEMAR